MKTWIMVANASRARLFEAGAHNSELTELADYAFPESRMHGDQFTREHAGRVQESACSARHGIEPRLDPHDKASMQFAHELVGVLKRGRVEHAFERLVLMASPRFLGQLRGALDDPLTRLVVESVDKDLSHASAAEIEAALQL